MRPNARKQEEHGAECWGRKNIRQNARRGKNVRPKCQTARQVRPKSRGDVR